MNQQLKAAVVIITHGAWSTCWVLIKQSVATSQVSKHVNFLVFFFIQFTTTPLRWKHVDLLIFLHNAPWPSKGTYGQSESKDWSIVYRIVRIFVAEKATVVLLLNLPDRHFYSILDIYFTEIQNCTLKTWTNELACEVNQMRRYKMYYVFN